MKGPTGIHWPQRIKNFATQVLGESIKNDLKKKSQALLGAVHHCGFVRKKTADDTPFLAWVDVRFLAPVGGSVSAGVALLTRLNVSFGVHSTILYRAL